MDLLNHLWLAHLWLEFLRLMRTNSLNNSNNVVLEHPYTSYNGSYTTLILHQHDVESHQLIKIRLSAPF